MNIMFNDDGQVSADPTLQRSSQPKPEFRLIETTPAIPALSPMLNATSKLISSPCDLVEPMYFLYVNVVEGLNLNGCLNPYVEVKLGNCKATTKNSDDSCNPIWCQVFAFSKEKLQASSLEVMVKASENDQALGSVVLDVSDIPTRSPQDGPLSPLCYRLEGSQLIRKGKIKLAVWSGTQADAAFATSWHADGLMPAQRELCSPKLCYLRVHIVEARDIVLSDKSRGADVSVQVQLGSQRRMTRRCKSVSINPIWYEHLFFVVADPFNEQLVVSVVDRVGPLEHDLLGNVIFLINGAYYDGIGIDKPVEARWFDLCKPSTSDGTIDGVRKKRGSKIVGKIHFEVYLNTVDPVIYEQMCYVSNIQPVNKQAQKPSIGILELGILDARNLITSKRKNCHTVNPYCVAMYGSKWVRTRTVNDTSNPRWNEQFSWEVFDPCTVITVAIFNNCHLSCDEKSIIHRRIGKIRIRLSTLENKRAYTLCYPLLVLQTSGLCKTGELHLAIRFNYNWVKMVALYGKPLHPGVQHLPFKHMDFLQFLGGQVVRMRLGKAEPPLHREVVEYMLSLDSLMWSLRRCKVNVDRLTFILSSFELWLNGIRNWENPMTTTLVHILIFMLISSPELILPTIFICLSLRGLWNYQFRPRHPPHTNTNLSNAELTDPDELDEEFDTYPTTKSLDIVRARYDSIRLVTGKWQRITGDLATQGERVQAMLSWRDPRGTIIFMAIALLCAVVFYYLSFQMVMMFVGLYFFRHPKFRTPMPSVIYNLFSRLPDRSDALL